jgi:hypothetical protein
MFIERIFFLTLQIKVVSVYTRIVIRKHTASKDRIENTPEIIFYKKNQGLRIIHIQKFENPNHKCYLSIHMACGCYGATKRQRNP